ncbi:EamA family transporter [Virgibacillus sp. NKC19-3]|uniref:DMT family transporter n=1 Tax=Virgibacillus saliphilus TaxID=2831674 RepID=UPI001C9AE7A3|nr:DMT family transporter [Virgibacillus sp. NKC19-3]MBY7144026.1 EamA family transporter [Virgibacillus sp. NKC19-3]
MATWALIIVVISAVIHAMWNFLAKKSSGGTAFVWLYMVVSAVIYSPLAAVIIVLSDMKFGWLELTLILASAVLHMLYAVALQKGYRVGDFSLIYPIARGIGPMLIAISAFFLLGEELNRVGQIGILLIIFSVFIFTGGLRILQEKNVLPAILYGLLIGCIIASYSLLDKYIVSVTVIHPILLSYGSILGQVLLLIPFAKKHWQEVRQDWKQLKLETIGVGFLNPLAYILILMAMVTTPVSYVSPVRELSILIGAVLGVVFFNENFGRRRIIAAAIMVIGVIAIAIS